MREQAEAITRPYISVGPFAEPDNPILYLRISNTGKTTARNLRLTLDKSFYQFGKRSGEADLGSFAAFNEPIDSFPPGAEIVFSLALSSTLFAQDADQEALPRSFCVTAEYSYEGKRVEERNVIDLRPYLGANIPQDAYVRKLRDITQAIDKVASNLGKKP